eukprot:492257-Prymnesium_polylepis.2
MRAVARKRKVHGRGVLIAETIHTTGGHTWHQRVCTWTTGCTEGPRGCMEGQRGCTMYHGLHGGTQAVGTQGKRPGWRPARRFP